MGNQDRVCHIEGWEFIPGRPSAHSAYTSELLSIFGKACTNIMALPQSVDGEKLASTHSRI